MKARFFGGWVLALSLAAAAAVQPGRAWAEDEGDEAKAGSLKGSLDDRIKSVQHKYFIKRHRFELTPYGSLNLNDPFKTRYMLGLQGVFHVVDPFAVGFTYGYILNKESSQTIIVRQVGAPPDTSDLKHNISLDFYFTPIYGKLSIFAEWILHFDWYFIVGGGALMAGVPEGTDPTQTAGVTKMAFNAGLGQRYFFGKWFAVKLELRDYIYSLQVASDQLDQGVRDLQNQLYAFVGASFYIPFDFDYEE